MQGKLTDCSTLVNAKDHIDATALDTGFVTDTLCPSIEDLANLSASWPSQRVLANVLHVARYRSLLTAAGLVDRRHESWLRSCGKFGSGLWLQALPQLRCFQADPDVYKVMLATRLLVPLARSSLVEIPRCACGEPHDSSFVTGSHFHGKCKCGKVLSQVHHAEARLCP